MDYALKITGLTKRYGKKLALDGLNMKVPQNSLYGFLGENGAGKTTTFSILGGFIRANDGKFEWKGQLGMLPQDARFGLGRKIGEQLKVLARLSGIDHAQVETEVTRVLKAVGMEEYRQLTLEKCSHGMYKRVGIAQALLGNPDILLFDEPTAGLDPKNAHDIRQLIQQLNHQKTVVISSHNLAEIEEMCSHVGIINKGKMIYEGLVKDLIGQNSTLSFGLSEKPDIEALEKISTIKKMEWREAEKMFWVEFDQNVIASEKINAQILSQLLKTNIGIRSLNSGRSLEQEYLKQLNLS